MLRKRNAKVFSLLLGENLFYYFNVL